MSVRRIGGLFMVAVLTSACVGEGDAPQAAGATEGELRSNEGVRLQAGNNLTVLGVTEDDFVLYWDSGSVWATEIKRNAGRRLVAANVAEPPLTLSHGKVAMIWTAQPFLGNILGPQRVSPLVVWTVRNGPQLASTASLAPQLFAIQASAAVRPDSREVVFTSNVSEDGSVGDIVRASTDLGTVTTLLSAIDVSLGRCAPHVGYDRAVPIGEPRIIVSACTPGAGTATLSRWRGDERVDLTTSMRVGISWTSDELGEHVLTQLSDNSPAVFTPDNAFTIVDSHRTATGWITPDGTVFQTPVNADRSGRDVFRIKLGATPHAERVTTLPVFSGIQFANHLPYGVPYANVSTVPMAPNRAFLVAFTAFNDVDGSLTDSLRIDARATDVAPVASSAAPVSLPAFEIATRDSRFNLFHVFAPDDFTHSVLFAGSARGEARQISKGETTLGIFGISGSRIAFADNVTATLFGGDIDATGDLTTVDLAASTPAPVTVARGAHAHFFLTRSRDLIVYSTDADPAASGLVVQRIAP
jgi:hypothetical protein